MSSPSTLSPLTGVRELASSAPTRTAFIFEGESISYLRLSKRANAVANGLTAAHLPRQSRIALLDFNHLSYAEILIGALQAGHALCPINARLAPPEVAWILNDSRAPILFVGRDHYALIEGIESQLAHVRKIIAIHGEHPRWQSYAQWRDAAPTEFPTSAISWDEDIIQLYTSGTTGNPKGVQHTHRTWADASAAVREVNPSAFAADCVNLICLPLFHVAGFNPLCFTLAGG